jgi:hypothetical protein
MARYFLDLKEVNAPERWDPHAGPHPSSTDTRYFGGVFREMEPLLADGALDLYLTRSWERLPAYGERVVAVVLSDEVGHIPRYVGNVRAVFKCYGTRPALGVGPRRDPSLAGLGELIQWSVRWLRWLPEGAAYARLVAGRRARGRPAPPLISTIPLGTYNQLELPIVPIDERPTDIFFAGSIEHHHRLRHRLGDPKSRSRREMMTAVDQLVRRRPELRAELRATTSFEASAAAPAADYSQALMNAKVCLAPRGTSPETFRFFEGMRTGCVVVGGGLPPHWFYEGAPMIRLDRWAGLGDVLEPVLDDPRELRRIHRDALSWWRERCSEAAVGRFVAERLNAVSALA